MESLMKDKIRREILRTDQLGVFTTECISEEFARHLRELGFKWVSGETFNPSEEQRKAGIKINYSGEITWLIDSKTTKGTELGLIRLYELFNYTGARTGYKLYQVSKNTHSQLLLRELDGQPEEGYTLTRAKEEQIKKLDSLGATSIDIAIAKVENICKQTTKTEVVREII